MPLPSPMANSPPLILAGAGGMDVTDFATDYIGRKAILLTRDENTWEFEELAETMGLNIVEVIFQSGKEDPSGFFGKGRLEDVGDELSMRPKGHPWHEVDLVLVHLNATPRQLVSISKAVGIEVWDRVRLLLTLFTTHASSVEARTQVRLARLRADRSVLPADRLQQHRCSGTLAPNQLRQTLLGTPAEKRTPGGILLHLLSLLHL